MDEYRGRHDHNGRREQHSHQPHHPPHHPPQEASPPREPEGERGLLEQFGIGGDWLEEYLPVLLILLGALGIYLWMGKQNEGLSGLVGRFLK